MATKNKFHIYTGNPVDKTKQLIDDEGDFSSYEKGAEAGEPVSSKNVNTGLRTSTLVSKALISALTKGQTVSKISALNTHDEVKAFIEQGIKETKVNSASNADSATKATYASDDTSKGTIEQRLTDLGFKDGGSKTLQYFWGGGHNCGSIALKKLGKYVLARVNFTSYTQGGNIRIDGALPEGFRPQSNKSYPINISRSGSSDITITIQVSASGSEDGIIISISGVTSDTVFKAGSSFVIGWSTDSKFDI